MVISEILYKKQPPTDIEKDDPYYRDDDPEDYRWFAKGEMEDEIKKQRANSTHKMLGMGSFAYVGTNDDENFGDVHRISKADEGNSTYLTAIASTPSIQSNPYLPKVRNIKTGNGSRTVTLERLVPFTTPGYYKNKTLLTTLWNQWFHIPIVSSGAFRSQIELAMETAMSLMKIVKDPLLKQALLFIEKVAKEQNLEYDIRTSNMMWRPTQFGPQLVFTDPLWDEHANFQ